MGLKEFFDIPRGLQARETRTLWACPLDCLERGLLASLVEKIAVLAKPISINSIR